MIRTLQGKVFATTAAVLLGYLALSLVSVELLVTRFAERGITRDLATARTASEQYLALRRDVLRARARTVAQTPFLKATLSIEALDAATASDTVDQLRDLAETPMLLLVGADGHLLADATNAGRHGEDLSGVDIIQRAFDGRDVEGLWAYRGHPHLVAASPVVTGDHAAGVVVLGAPVDDTMAEDLRRVAGADVLLTGPSGVVGSAWNNASAPAEATEALRQFLATLPGAGADTATPVPWDADQRAVRSPLDAAVSVVLVRSLGDVLLLSRQQRWWLLGTTLVAAVIGLMASRVVATRLGRPITTLMRASEAVGGGDFSVIVPEHDQDELGVLSAGFNRMTGRIRRLMAESQAHLHALEAQREEIEQARDAALAANRAKSAFLANMSHELRTPLNAVIGYSELLIDEALDRDVHELVADLERVRASGLHLLALVSEVLDLAKVESGRETVTVEPVELDELVRDAVATMTPLATAGGSEIVIATRAPVGTVFTDAKKLRQVLYNLLGNACKFTRSGRITIETARFGSGDQVGVTVTDTGVGVPSDRLVAIFEPFTQVDDSTTRRFGGTGLGLAISRSYCELLGGSLTAESTLGVGSVFTATISSKRALAPPADAPAA